MDPRALSRTFQLANMDITTSEDTNGRLRLPPPASLYMSPPEDEGMHTFSQHPAPAPTKQDWTTHLAPIRLAPSPPASPLTSPLPRLPALNTDMSQHTDPPLFLRTRADSDVSTAPLFDTSARQDSLSPDQKRRGKKVVNETAIFGTFKTNGDVHDYIQGNLKELSGIAGFGTPCEPRMTPILNKSMHDYDMGVKRSLHRTGAGIAKTRKPNTKSPAQRVAKPAVKTQPSTVRTHTSTVKAQTSTVTTQPSTQTSTVKTQSSPAPRKRTPAAPQHRQTTPRHRQDRQTASLESTSAPRKRAPPTKQPPPKTSDALWPTLPDYCPPTTTLSTQTLKIHWKGSPAPLTNDPDRAHLHPAEAEAAAELRLTGSQYLANKRRIFIRRVDCLREGRTWTKTVAQQTCNVDVNKVSKLFEGFERVGWFDREWFEGFL